MSLRIIGAQIAIRLDPRRRACRRGHDWRRLPFYPLDSNFRACSRCGETGYLVPKEIA